MLTNCLQTFRPRSLDPSDDRHPLHWTGFRISIRQELAVKITLSYVYAALASSKPYINKLSRELLIYTLCNNLLWLGDCFNGFG
jgi:hypothetical protein